MVDALREAWRVLTPQGRLVDSRPLPEVAAVEAVAGARTAPVGEIDACGRMAEDLAADAAIAAEVEARRFRLVHRDVFPLATWWQDAVELAGYLTGRNSVRRISPPTGEMEAARRRHSEEVGEEARLRWARPHLLAVYEKAGSRPDG